MLVSALLCMFLVATIYIIKFSIDSINMNPALSSGFATCGEDGSVRLWAGGDCVAEIRLPVHSVWSVTCLDNGDVVTGEDTYHLTYTVKQLSQYVLSQNLKDLENTKCDSNSRTEGSVQTCRYLTRLGD